MSPMFGRNTASNSNDQLTPRCPATPWPPPHPSDPIALRFILTRSDQGTRRARGQASRISL